MPPVHEHVDVEPEDMTDEQRHAAALECHFQTCRATNEQRATSQLAAELAGCDPDDIEAVEAEADELDAAEYEQEAAARESTGGAKAAIVDAASDAQDEAPAE